jgi:hypothetical protein
VGNTLQHIHSVAHVLHCGPHAKKVAHKASFGNPSIRRKFKKYGVMRQEKRGCNQVDRPCKFGRANSRRWLGAYALQPRGHTRRSAIPQRCNKRAQKERKNEGVAAQL